VLAKEAPELRDLVQPRKLYTEHESSPIISSHLTFPEKKASPHSGTFKAPLRSRPGRDIDEAISNVKDQLRVMEAEMQQKVETSSIVCFYTNLCYRNWSLSGSSRRKKSQSSVNGPS
jgi:hypothetical protein